MPFTKAGKVNHYGVAGVQQSGPRHYHKQIEHCEGIVLELSKQVGKEEAADKRTYRVEGRGRTRHGGVAHAVFGQHAGDAHEEEAGEKSKSKSAYSVHDACLGDMGLCRCSASAASSFLSSGIYRHLKYENYDADQIVHKRQLPAHQRQIARGEGDDAGEQRHKYAL